MSQDISLGILVDEASKVEPRGFGLFDLNR